VLLVFCCLDLSLPLPSVEVSGLLFFLFDMLSKRSSDGADRDDLEGCPGCDSVVVKI
jgi:hypothetical protein